MPRLTDVQIRKSSTSDKPLRLYDERGLYLEVRPNGGKWWRLKYRHAGKEKLLSLGTYPDTSLKDARERRDKERQLLASGVDPSVGGQAKSRAAPLRPPIERFRAVDRSSDMRLRPGGPTVIRSRTCAAHSSPCLSAHASDY
jgi:hypothetical protein